MSLDEKTRLLEAGGSSALDWIRLDKIEEYSYRPLPKGSFTRVIELDQARGSEEIYCKLRQIPYKRLGSCVFPYRAVSYAWGEQPTFTEKLWIQDEPGVYLPITKEVKQMLKALMDSLPHQKTCRLWVDVVCINQADLKEKARQITRMGDIYSSAEEVLVWLGDGPEVLNSLGHISQMFGHTKHFTERDNLITHFNYDTREQLKSSCISLLDLPWFDRRWVIQEVVCAKKATIFSETLRMDFYLLLEIFLYFKDSELKQSWRFEAHRSILGLRVGLSRGRDLLSYSEDFSLTVLDRFRHAKCSDARDRIFAFAGIGLLRSAMEVNYSASVEDVYTDFARAMIKSSVRDYRVQAMILQYACAFPDTLHKSLPSWVPDWRNTRQFRRLPFYKSFIMPPFNKPKRHATEFHGIDELLMKGFVNGRIRSIFSTNVPRLCDYPQTSAWEAEILSYLHKAWVMAFKTTNAWSTFVRNQDPARIMSPEQDPDQTKLMNYSLSELFVTISANTLPFNTPNFTHLRPTDLEPEWGELWKYREWNQHISSLLSGFPHATFLKSESTVVPPLGGNPNEKEIVTHRLSVIQAVMEGRSFFVTEDGNMGITSSRCQEGDLVCSFITAGTHFVVRPNTQFEYSDDLTVQLIGDAYYSFGVSVDVVKGESPRQFIIV